MSNPRKAIAGAALVLALSLGASAAGAPSPEKMQTLTGTVSKLQAADRTLVGCERRAWQRTEGLRRGVVGPAVRTRVAATSATPADRLASGPNQNPSLNGSRQRSPRVRRGVVRRGREGSPGEHLLTGPDGAAAVRIGAELRRRRKPLPGLRRRVVRLRKRTGADSAAEDDQLPAGPDGRGGQRARRRGRDRLPGSGDLGRGSNCGRDDD